MSKSTTKYCPGCQRDLPLDAYTPSQRNRPSVWCAECQRAYNREYYKANKDRLDPINRAYAEQHRDELRAYGRRYHEEHSDYERRKPYYEERYQANRDEIREKQRAYQQAHPEGSARRSMRHAARKKGATGNHTVAEWKALRSWFGGRCLCCGTRWRLEADHVIPLDRGGSDDISNIQPLCRSCNASKHTRSTDYRDPELLAAFLRSLLF